MSAASVTPRNSNKMAVAEASGPVKASEKTIQEMTEVFKLLGDRSRLKIVLALAHEGEMHVGALCDMLGGEKKASQPAVSHHLSLMRAHGLVSYRRDGKNNYYRLDSSYISAILDQFFVNTANGPKQMQFEDFTLVYKRK